MVSRITGDTGMRLWNSSVTATLAVMAVLSVSTTAAAQREPRRAQAAEEVAQRQTGEPIMAIVSTKTQRITLYDAEGWILHAPVSTGTTERETPAGVFAVVEKKRDHRSNMYDDAHMPHMQRITWNGIALHGGPLPGYAASHGCVRLPFGFAERLFDKTRIGMRVIVAPNDAVPVEISHPAQQQREPEEEDERRHSPPGTADPYEEEADPDRDQEALPDDEARPADDHRGGGVRAGNAVGP
jgi:hypothetical protein